jgi:hypothetical protein
MRVMRRPDNFDSEEIWENINSPLVGNRTIYLPILSRRVSKVLVHIGTRTVLIGYVTYVSWV